MVYNATAFPVSALAGKPKPHASKGLGARVILIGKSIHVMTEYNFIMMKCRRLPSKDHF